MTHLTLTLHGLRPSQEPPRDTNDPFFVFGSEDGATAADAYTYTPFDDDGASGSGTAGSLFAAFEDAAQSMTAHDSQSAAAAAAAAAAEWSPTVTMALASDGAPAAMEVAEQMLPAAATDLATAADAAAVPAECFAIEPADADDEAAPDAPAAAADAAPLGAAATFAPPPPSPAVPTVPSSSSSPAAGNGAAVFASPAPAAASATGDEEAESPAPIIPALEPPPATAAPQLVDATLNSLTVTWDLAPGATGYYVDIEFRGRDRDDAALRAAIGAEAVAAAAVTWRGDGSRAVFAGECCDVQSL